MTTTITVDPHALKRALAAVTRYIPADFPNFAGIRLRVGRRWLVVSATDRYAYCRVRVPLDTVEGDGFDGWMTTVDTKTITDALTHAKTATIILTPSDVTLGTGTRDVSIHTTTPPHRLIRAEESIFETSYLGERCPAGFNVHQLHWLPRLRGRASHAEMFNLGAFVLFVDAFNPHLWQVALTPSKCLGDISRDARHELMVEDWKDL